MELKIVSLSGETGRFGVCFGFFTMGEVPAAGIAGENGTGENVRLRLPGRGGYFRSKVLEYQRRDEIKRCLVTYPGP